MKRLVIVATLATLLVGSVLLGLRDVDISVADTRVYDMETYIRPHEASNSSASGTIAITIINVWVTNKPVAPREDLRVQ